MVNATVRSVLILLPMAVLACGRVPGKPGGIPAGDAPEEIAKAVCPKAYDCCMPDQLMGNELAGTDEPSCEQKTAEGFRNNLAAVLASEKKFRSDYDGTKLEACLAYIRSATCEELGTTNHFSGVPGCDSFVAARLAVGETCDWDWECVDGWCDKTSAPPNGICQPLAKDGESCETIKCLKGSICDSVAKTCTQPLADGATCARSDQCANRNCNVVAGAGTCEPAKGGMCFYSSSCSAVGGRPGVVSLAIMMIILGVTLFRRVGGRAGRPQRSRAPRTR